MPTYTRNGHIHGRFNAGRHSKYDGVGRGFATDFFQGKGWTVSDYDKHENGVFYDRPDLKVTKEEKVVYIEAAIKSSKLWKWIKAGNPDSGVDVETRKLKYFKEDELSYVAMSNDDGSEIMLIPMECLSMAQQDCGDEYKGHRDVTSSENFQMPKHGCHRVRKKCSSGYNQTGDPEDFYRIPYEYISHYRKEGEKYVLHKQGKMPKKVKHGN